MSSSPCRMPSSRGSGVTRSWSGGSQQLARMLWFPACGFSPRSKLCFPIHSHLDRSACCLRFQGPPLRRPNASGELTGGRTRCTAMGPGHHSHVEVRSSHGQVRAPRMHRGRRHENRKTAGGSGGAALQLALAGRPARWAKSTVRKSRSAAPSTLVTTRGQDPAGRLHQ